MLDMDALSTSTTPAMHRLLMIGERARVTDAYNVKHYFYSRLSWKKHCHCRMPERPRVIEVGGANDDSTFEMSILLTAANNHWLLSRQDVLVVVRNASVAIGSGPDT